MGGDGARHAPPVEAFAHCETLVREQAPDRATALLFAAPDKRAALGALYAFDLEVSAIRDRVSQPLAGEIRLQWWRDVISGAGAGDGGGQGSPIADALLHTIRAHALPLDAFERLLDARIFDLYDDPMPDRTAFETYAGETASAVVVLAAMILDHDRAPGVAALAGHAGVAEAAFGVAANDGRLRARNQILVPADILQSLGLDSARYLAGERNDMARQAMAAYGSEHARRVVDGWAGLPRSVRPAFLPLRAALADGDGIARGRSSRFAALRRTAAFWRAMRAPEATPR